MYNVRNRAWAVAILARRAAASLALVALGTILALLLVEVALRVWNPFPFRVKGDRIVLPIHQEYQIRVPLPNGGERLIVHRKNSLGFRGPELPADTDARLTIVTIGGSTTECFYLGEGETWPDRLAEWLRNAAPDLWLNNAGLDGHSTFGHVVLLKDHVLRLNPKVVLFLVGVNDVGVEQPRLNDRRNFVDLVTPEDWRGMIIALANRSEAVGLILNLYRAWRAHAMGVTHSFWAAEPRASARASSDAEVADILMHHRTKFLPAYVDRLNTLAELVQGQGALPVFLTQPARFRPRDGESTTQEWQILDLYNEATRQFAANRSVFLIDLARELASDDSYFYDNIHFAGAGARAVGDLVGRRLCPVLKDRFGDAVPGICPL